MSERVPHVGDSIRVAGRAWTVQYVEPETDWTMRVSATAVIESTYPDGIKGRPVVEDLTIIIPTELSTDHYAPRVPR